MLFSEKVQSPRVIRIGLALIVTLFLLAVVYSLTPDLLPTTISIPGYVVLILFITFILFGMITLSFGVRVSVQEQTFLNGKTGLVLSLLGTSHAQRLSISTLEIDNIEEITFDESIIKSLVGSWFDEPDSAYVLRQFGYKGNGLAVRYSIKSPRLGNPNSESPQINVVHFPVQESAVLFSLLKQAIENKRSKSSDKLL